MRSTIVLASILASIVIAVLVWAIGTWTTPGGEALSIHAYVALGLGALGTVALGGGLMALVFFSSRHGYDDDAHRRDEADSDTA